MKLFEIALPQFSNNGKSFDLAHSHWQTAAAEIAGGYTELPAARGCWRDPSTGKEYHDIMIAYRVTCTRKALDRLIEVAFDLFADQVALFVSEIGNATIINREDQNVLSKQSA